jgi:uncharacterized membrane protein YfcA
MLVPALMFAALIGLALGMLGGGGSILTVPVLVYVARVEPKTAIAMSLAVVGVTSAVGALGHWRAGNVNVRVAVLFGALAMAGAYAGARLSVFVSAALQLVLLGVVMLAAAASMLRGMPRRVAIAGADNARPEVPHPLALRGIAPVAVGVGVLTGIVGIGGGFLVVPALVLFGRVPMQHAVGTSLVVIAMNCASGFVGHLEHVGIPWRFAGLFTGVAIMGILLGTHLARFVSHAALKRGFAVFLIATGAFVLYRNRDVLVRALALTHRAAVVSAAD